MLSVRKTDREKIIENMKIPPEEKLKRLKRIVDFTEYFSTKRAKRVRKALMR